jgi:hypothetical protein
MTDPIVTELPQVLEPTTRDPFLDEAATGAPVIRELDQRRSDGIDTHTPLPAGSRTGRTGRSHVRR